MLYLHAFCIRVQKLFEEDLNNYKTDYRSIAPQLLHLMYNFQLVNCNKRFHFIISCRCF